MGKRQSKETPSYLNFDEEAYPWKSDVDYKKHPEFYRVGKGEQGVLICEPYKSEIGQFWRFKTKLFMNCSLAIWKNKTLSAQIWRVNIFKWDLPEHVATLIIRAERCTIRKMIISLYRKELVSRKKQMLPQCSMPGGDKLRAMIFILR